jgi:type IV secretion system protein VirB9
MRVAVLLCLAGMLGAADPPQSVTIDGPRSVTVGERSVVPVYICPLQETLLILPTNEKVMKSFVADTANWKLESGREDQASRYLSIKVREPLTRETTLNVVSDHEANYTFKLVLNEQHCDSKVSIDADSQLTEVIRKTEPWLSPAEGERLMQQMEQAKQASAETQRKAQAETDAWRASYPSKLHFDYKWDPKAAEKLGVHAIWHDDRFTYISATPEETPALYELKEGKPSLISFVFSNGVYWTGRVVKDGYLAVGGNGNGKHQEKLEFHRVGEGN